MESPSQRYTREPRLICDQSDRGCPHRRLRVQKFVEASSAFGKSYSAPSGLCLQRPPRGPHRSDEPRRVSLVLAALLGCIAVILSQGTVELQSASAVASGSPAFLALP